MIIVEIYVPSADREYDFEIDEHAPVRMVIEEIVVMICQKEQCRIQGDTTSLVLGDRDRQRILSMTGSLKENQVETGTKLILV